MDAINLFKRCNSPIGYLASSTSRANYRRVWTRDSMICSLAALQTGNERLIDGVKKSIETVLTRQHPDGFVPENVTLNNRADYGYAVGRVDSALWVVIGFCQYIQRTKDYAFYQKWLSEIKKILVQARAWELNGRNLIYVPEGGDWADEYVTSGYNLSDQVLHYLATRMFEEITHISKEKSNNIAKTIRASYDFTWKRRSKWVYNQKLYDLVFTHLPHPAASFSASNYNLFFDGLGCSLLLHTPILSKHAVSELKKYVKREFKHYLIPAFYPVIMQNMPQWRALEQSYVYSFGNQPYQYHNGGLWPFITGIYGSALPRNSAQRFLTAIKKHNSKGFYEYAHGLTLEPLGTKNQLWSAAGEIFVSEALKGNPLFIFGDIEWKKE